MATAEEFFADCPVGRATYDLVTGLLPEAEVRVTRSQVALRGRRGFAYLWRPGAYVRTSVPVVLSLALPHRIDSPRWKEVVQPSEATWMHHLEVREVADLDDEVVGWLLEAAELAGSG